MSKSNEIHVEVVAPNGAVLGTFFYPNETPMGNVVNDLKGRFAGSKLFMYAGKVINVGELK